MSEAIFSPVEDAASAIKKAPNWFLRFLAAVLMMMVVGAVRVENRFTQLEERDHFILERMAAQDERHTTAMEVLTSTTRDIHDLLQVGLDGVQEGRETRIKLEAQYQEVNRNTQELLKLHGRQ